MLYGTILRHILHDSLGVPSGIEPQVSIKGINSIICPLLAFPSSLLSLLPHCCSWKQLQIKLPISEFLSQAFGTTKTKIPNILYCHMQAKEKNSHMFKDLEKRYLCTFVIKWELSKVDIMNKGLSDENFKKTNSEHWNQLSMELSKWLWWMWF